MLFESNSSCTVAPRPFGNTAPLGPQIWSLLLGGNANGAFGNQNSSPLESTSAFSSPAFGASTSASGTSSTTAFGSSSSPFNGRPTQDTQSAGGAASLFGQSSANPFSSPSGPFGATSSTSSLSSFPNITPSMFSTTDSSTFGTSKTLFGTSMGQGTTNPFDPDPNFSTSLLFSKLSTPSMPPSSSPFGQSMSSFGQNTSTFGQSAPNPPSSDSCRNLFQSVPSSGQTNELGTDSGSGGTGKCDLKVSGTTLIALITGEVFLTATDGMRSNPDNLDIVHGYDFVKVCWLVDEVYISICGCELTGKAVADGVRMDLAIDRPSKMKKIAKLVRDKANRHNTTCEFIVGGKLDDGILELYQIRRPEDGFPYDISKGYMFILGKGSEDAKTCMQNLLGGDFSKINNLKLEEQMELLRLALLSASKPGNATGGRFTFVGVDAMGKHEFAVSKPSNPYALEVAKRGYGRWQRGEFATIGFRPDFFELKNANNWTLKDQADSLHKPLLSAS